MRAFHGFVKKRRITLRNFMNGPIVEHGMTVCVLGNTVVLCLDYYGANRAPIYSVGAMQTIAGDPHPDNGSKSKTTYSRNGKPFLG